MPIKVNGQPLQRYVRRSTGYGHGMIKAFLPRNGAPVQTRQGDGMPGAPFHQARRRDERRGAGQEAS